MKNFLRNLLLFFSPLLKRKNFLLNNGLAKGMYINGVMGLMAKFHGIDIGEEFIRKIPIAGKTVYDIGAHIGVYSLFFSKAVGDNGIVIAFEPNLDNYTALLKNLEINNISNVIAQKIALGSGIGESKFFVPSSDTKRGSLNKEFMPKGCNLSILSVPVDSIDNLIKRGLQAPGFIKIDVEGGEFDVLKGAELTLEKYKPNLLVEIHGLDKKNWIDNARKIFSFLEQKNYRIFGVTSLKYLNSNASDNEIIECGPAYCSYE
ncbi:FkbM family methyltransferase [Candidatus Wolfebacteria bacterium]|nr:FkbM family methyltransferase [Candidatus Wolfebacteria bacterium]